MSLCGGEAVVFFKSIFVFWDAYVDLRRGRRKNPIGVLFPQDQRYGQRDRGYGEKDWDNQNKKRRVQEYKRACLQILVDNRAVFQNSGDPERIAEIFKGALRGCKKLFSRRQPSR